MRRLITGLGAGTVSALLMLAAFAHGDEQEVPLGKVPKPVLQAVKDRFGGAEVTGASREREEGALVYEVAIEDKGQRIDVTLSPEGEILLIEREIAAGDLPAAVAKTLQDRYADATYRIVEQIAKVDNKQEKVVSYEVLLVTAEAKMLEVEITAEGEVLHEEKGDLEEDEEEDDE
jgi:hypothetical protein